MFFSTDEMDSSAYMYTTVISLGLYMVVSFITNSIFPTRQAVTTASSSSSAATTMTTSTVDEADDRRLASSDGAFFDIYSPWPWFMAGSEYDNALILKDKARLMVRSRLYSDDRDEMSASEASRLQDVCPICLLEFKSADMICSNREQCCRHVFHNECLLDWLQSQQSCPCCRKAIR